MQITASVDVRCECNIPFHTELVNYLVEELDSSLSEDAPIKDIPHKENVMKALQSKMLFIKLVRPVKKIRPKIIKRLKRIFRKDLIGTIEEGGDEVTFILL